MRRPSPALVIACLALFVSLSGGAYALTVTGKNIKNRTITGKDVKKRTLTAQHFKGNRVGRPGPPGPPGPAGTGVLAEISGAVTMPAVQSPTTVPIALSGGTFTTQSAAWVGGVASFPNGHPCSGAQSLATVLVLYVDGQPHHYIASDQTIISGPSTEPFALSVGPGTHTVTAEGRASCSNAPLSIVLNMSVFGR
jgi:hypothetical protein